MSSPSARPLEGRVAVVTGATSGIGQETALGLAARGAQVVMVGRDPARADEALRDVRARSGSDRVEVRLADFASLDAVRGLARGLRESFDGIHILVNNAGVVMSRRETTVDGYEMALAVNHLAPFLLTNLLRERLLSAGQARVVTVASDAHKFTGAFDFDDPMSEHKYGFPGAVSGLRVYGMTKLANILFNLELARRLEGSGVTANAVHPGAVATRLGTNNGGIGVFAQGLLRFFVKTPEQGAATSLHVATAPELEKTSGRYFADCREIQPGAAARAPQDAARLWRESCAWVGLDEAAV